MNPSEVPDELRGVAPAAVRRFLEEDASLELLGHGQSLTYRVDASSGRYLLRVHAPVTPPADPEFFTVETIESECAWLRALGDETELVVQRPVPGPDGRHVLPVQRAGGDEAVPCTLLRWVEGELVTGRRSDEQAARLGELLAALQRHAERWKPPAGFTRPIHDRRAARNKLARAEGLVALGIVTADDAKLFARALDRTEDELAPLDDDPARVGLIHADLHETNYVFHDGFPRPIDFSCAVYGPWLYDVAECATHLHPDGRRALVEAYAQERHLADGDLRRIEGYFVASLIEVLGYHAPNPREHDYLREAAPRFAGFARRYLDGRPFLFGV